jgi:hypothetical protein
MVADALRGLVGEPVREETTIDQMLAERKDGTQETQPRAQVPPQIAQEIIHSHMDKHYRETLDRPVPALGNVSPREAVRSAAGRSKVVDWLKDMENRTAKSGGYDPMASYDFRWIWRELGVADLRA